MKSPGEVGLESLAEAGERLLSAGSSFHHCGAKTKELRLGSTLLSSLLSSLSSKQYIRPSLQEQL